MTEIGGDGWTGQTLSLDVQQVILIKHFVEALEMILRELAMVHKDLKPLAMNQNVEEMLTGISEHPFYESVLARLIIGEQEFGDQLHRKTAQEIFAEVAPEIQDAMVYTTTGMWVNQGCTLPEGLIEALDEEPDVGEEE